MNLDELEQQLGAFRARVRALQRRAGESHDVSSDALLEALAELTTALEEFRVTEEALHQQGDELVATRDQAEEERQRYRDFFDFAPDAYLVTDSHGIIREANRATEELLGVSAPAISGKPVASFIAVENRGEFRHALDRASAAGRLDEWETRLVPHRKEALPAAITAALVRDRGDQPRRLLWLIRDVRARKQAEAQVGLLTAELELRDRVLTDVSHDLKNPLMIIKGYAQMGRQLAARTSPVDTAKLDDMLGKIDGAVTKMTGQINELLDATRLRLGKPLTLERHPTDLVALARQTAAEYQATSERHRILVETTLPELVGEWDAGRLERVLGNLLANAIKYSPEGGDVRVEVASEADSVTSWAVVTVTDQGVGIPASDIDHLFERFHRAGNVVEHAQGTGLGLASARQIVGQHGGTIGVTSREGVGSTFTMRLPLTPPATGR